MNAPNTSSQKQPPRRRGAVRVAGADVEAVILDLDGVVTRTARVHARAWKQMFDAYLEGRAEATGQAFEAFTDEDYKTYVDGKPRYEGVRSFLESRGIELPYGSPDDDPQQETTCGLGNRKNRLFHGLLAEGVEVFDDAVEMIGRWRQRGLASAVVSSSKNCRAVLEAAGLEELFDARVDGVEAAELGLAGKPAPDTFLKAAEKLGVEPGRAAVFEDAVAGVEAGRAGDFARVIGVARTGDPDQLKQHGAEVVVRSLDELAEGPQDAAASTKSGRPAGGLPHSVPPSAMAQRGEIFGRLRDHEPAVFLDYDGTLTPIVPRPEDARLDPETRATIRQLAGRCTVAIVSGRDRADVEKLVGLPELIYAGSHGFDITGPGGLRHEHPRGVECLPELDAAQEKLRERLGGIEGVHVERKRFAVAVHYRNAPESAVDAVRGAAEQVRSEQPALRMRGGKKIFELSPDVEWDKGRAVLWLLEILGLDRPGVLPFYLGDDLTDEDAFRALAGRQAGGIGVFVGEVENPTQAAYRLRSTDEVRVFLEVLLKHQ
jgi:alpha,alpha-trehalase